MFDSLSERLERSFKILKGEGKITEINIAEALKAQGVTTAEGEEISTSKASSMCRQMVDENRLTVKDVKVKGKGEQTQYTIAPIEE